MSSRKPIRRDKNLAPLSREHHYGLLFCWKIRQGIKENIEPLRLRNYLIYFWQQYLINHLAEEECVVFPLVADPLIDRAISEHQKLYDLANLLSGAAQVSSGDMETFVNLLDDHIRFEERELFPLVERTLPESELERIGRIIEHSIPDDNYEDQFWVKAADKDHVPSCAT